MMMSSDEGGGGGGGRGSGGRGSENSRRGRGGRGAWEGGRGGRGNRNRNRKRRPAEEEAMPDLTSSQKLGKTIPSVRDLESKYISTKMPAPDIAPAPATARPAIKAGAALKFSSSRFADLNIDSNTRRAIAETFKYEFHDSRARRDLTSHS